MISAGNFFGATGLEGVDGDGIIFEMTPSGTVTTLHSFDGTDGNGPGALVQDTNGIFYGVTSGAQVDNGTIFSLSVGLGAFVKTQPASGKVGMAVRILGNNLTGATSVTFNGTAANFKVVSKTEMTTTVSDGRDYRDGQSDEREGHAQDQHEVCGNAVMRAVGAQFGCF
jgi:uncharacterized repeat protein (TIGR03803 family)